MDTALSRRTLIRTMAGVGGGLVLGFVLPGATAAVTPPRSWTPMNDSTETNAWLAIDADGTVTIRVPHSEQGQGGLTSVALLVAEELDVPWRQVGTVFADMHRHVNDGQPYPVAALVQTLLLWGWHLPAAIDAAWRNEVVHDAMHASLFAARGPAARRPRHVGAGRDPLSARRPRADVRLDAARRAAYADVRQPGAKNSMIAPSGVRTPASRTFPQGSSLMLTAGVHGSTPRSASVRSHASRLATGMRSASTPRFGGTARAAKSWPSSPGQATSSTCP